MIRLALLAPIGNSLYSRLVAHCAAAEPDVTLTAVVVRTPWSLSRMKSEFRRDGARLLAKARTKLLVGEERLSNSEDSIGAFARHVGLRARTLRDFAMEGNIPYLEVPDHNAPAAVALLRHADPDVIAFTGGGLIRGDLLSIPRMGILNCHCGLLPEYRGMDVVEWPAAESRFDAPGIGITLHFMDAGLDTGPILLRRSIELRRGDTLRTVRSRIPRLQVELTMAGIRGLGQGTLDAQPQEVEAGRQYFVMHPRMLQFAEQNLDRHLMD